MLKKFALWFICFGLSFLAESLGLAEQGKAFLLINLGEDCLILFFILIVCLLGGDGLGERIGIPVLSAVIFAVAVLIILVATWGATKIFDIDYYVVFQIMTFGQCLCTSTRRKDD